jgi:hypothetical protein
MRIGGRDLAEAATVFCMQLGRTSCASRAEARVVRICLRGRPRVARPGLEGAQQARAEETRRQAVVEDDPLAAAELALAARLWRGRAAADVFGVATASLFTDESVLVEIVVSQSTVAKASSYGGLDLREAAEPIASHC